METDDAGFDWARFGIVLFIILIVIAAFVFLFSSDSDKSTEVAIDTTDSVELQDDNLNQEQIGGVEEMTDVTNNSQGNVTELVIEELEVGTGDEAVSGKSVTVHYTGTLTDGTKFDSSKDRGEPFTFDLGAGRVIKGWDQGVAGMKVGGVRKLTIPAELGYGAILNTLNQKWSLSVLTLALPRRQ